MYTKNHFIHALKLFSRVISSESFVLYRVMYVLTIDIYQSILFLRQKKKIP